MDSGSTHSFIHPQVLRDINCTISRTIPMIVMMANGEKMVTDTRCEGLTYSIQGYQFTDNLRVLNIQGYDVILGINWLAQYRPMQVDWLEKWIAFEKNGKPVKLQMREECAQIKMCQTVNIEKEIRNGGEVIVAQVMLIKPESNHTKTQNKEIKQVLARYSEIFKESTTLPPKRQFDHHIPLIPGAKPVNLMPYRYSHFQRIEMNKIIEELLKNSVI